MKLLILEDSVALAKILSIKIDKEIDIDIFTAHSLSEAKKLVQAHHFAIATLDLYLEDAQEEEVVDYFLEHDIPAIVMTGSADTNLQKRISQKAIIDYVLKDRSESIDYMIAHIKRVLQNRSHTALVVDDSASYRTQVENILKTQLLNTVTAANGAEALRIIRANHDISLVITDYYMPEVDGLELSIAIRKEFKKDQLPIIGMSTDNEGSILFLKHAVNDFVKKPFFKEELSTRVNNILDAMENVQKLRDYANTDYLTQVANRKAFYHDMTSYYKQSKKTETPFALAMIDIDHFKNVNDTYGHDIGDEVIKILAQTIQNNIKGRDIVARFGGEEFCVVLKDIPPILALKFFESLREKIAALRITANNGEQISFTISTGVVTNYQESLDEMLKESDHYLYEAKADGRNRVCSDQQLALA